MVQGHRSGSVRLGRRLQNGSERIEADLTDRQPYIILSLSSDKCTYCKLLWIKASTKCPKCKCTVNVSHDSYRIYLFNTCLTLSPSEGRGRLNEEASPADGVHFLCSLVLWIYRPRVRLKHSMRTLALTSSDLPIWIYAALPHIFEVSFCCLTCPYTSENESLGDKRLFIVKALLDIKPYEKEG